MSGAARGEKNDFSSGDLSVPARNPDCFYLFEAVRLIHCLSPFVTPASCRWRNLFYLDTKSDSVRFGKKHVGVEPEEASMTSQGAGRIQAADAPSQDAFLLYDGECPFCSFYARKSRFETRIGKPLRLIDARQAPELVAELRRDGCDIEEGMILVFDGRRHQGAAAMTALEAMTSADDWFNRLMRWVSSNPGRARILYPWLRMLRRAALWAKGKGKPSISGRG